MTVVTYYNNVFTFAAVAESGADWAGRLWVTVGEQTISVH